MGALIVIGAIAVIALLIWFVEVIKMYEVAILWLFVVVILSLVTIGTIHYIGTKKYNKLYEKTKPPDSVDKLIKAEAKYNPIGRVGIEGKLPHLIFYIRVINRTNYYFTPKKVFLACYHGKDPVFKEDWEERAKSPHIIPSELQRLADGSIQFHVPKQEIDNNMRELKLRGFVEYTTDEDIVHNHRKSVKVEIKNLEYKLDEETTPEPNGRVIIAK